jgi:hypothetical protein
MEVGFNLRTKRWNSLATMKRLGFFENPTNWTLAPGLFINLQTRKINSLTTARKTIKENPSLIVLPPDYLYNPFTKRIVKNTQRNQQLARPFIQHDISPETTFVDFYDSIKPIINSIPYPEYQLNVILEDGEVIDFINPTLNDVIDSIKSHFAGDSEKIYTSAKTIKVYQINPQVPRNLTQVFREGETNCLLTPIKLTYEKSHAETTSDKRRKTLARFIRIADELLKIYQDGVPQSKLQEVANTLEVKIIIQDFFGNLLFQTESIKNSRYRIIYRNTTANHTEVICDSVFEIDTQREMMEIKRRNKSRFYLCRRSGDRIMELQTAEGTFRYKMDKDPIHEFIEGLNINGLNIHSDTAKFIQSGTLITSHSFVNKHQSQENSQTIDMEKAYASAPTSCEYYQGFPATIWGLFTDDFTLDFVREHIGYYEIENIEFPEHLKAFSSMLNLGYSRVLPSPEILFYADQGFTFKITRGAFGKPRDIHIPENMYQKYTELVYRNDEEIETTTTPYKNMVGRLCMYRKLFYKKYEFSHSLATDFISFLRLRCPEAKFGHNSVYLPQQHATTKNFVGGFYTSYTRIQLLQQVFKSRPEDIIAICLDSITYPQNIQIPSYSSLWRIKPSKLYQSLADTFYPEYQCHHCESPRLPSILSRVQIWNGQGGSGKTTTAINTYPNLTYVAPTNLICASVWKNYGVKTYTTYALLGETPEDDTPNDYKTKNVGNPHTILVDEITMINNATIEKIVSRFPWSLIILAGDINEECRPYQATFGDETFKNENKYPFFTFTTDRRSQDEELKSLKLRIRECIDNKTPYLSLSPSITITDLPSHYNNETDYIIGYTNKMNQRITELIPDAKSYYITSTHKYKDELYYKGQIVKDIKPLKCERRVCFTTHSVQGRTIEEPSTLFIVLENGMLMDSKILYTAISRVRKMSQLVFVGLSPASSP